MTTFKLLSPILSAALLVAATSPALADAYSQTPQFGPPSETAPYPTEVVVAEVVEAPASVTTDKNAIGFTFGIGSPNGLVGIEIERALTNWLLVSGGVGLAARGKQFSGMLRLRRPFGPESTVGLGVGVSHGDAYANLQTKLDNATWGNMEAVIEFGGEDFKHRISAGASVLLRGSNCVTEEWTVLWGDPPVPCDETGFRDVVSPYVGYAIMTTF